MCCCASPFSRSCSTSVVSACVVGRFVSFSFRHSLTVARPIVQIESDQHNASVAGASFNGAAGAAPVPLRPVYGNVPLPRQTTADELVISSYGPMSFLSAGQSAASSSASIDTGVYRVRGPRSHSAAHQTLPACRARRRRQCKSRRSSRTARSSSRRRSTLKARPTDITNSIELRFERQTPKATCQMKRRAQTHR